MMASFSEGLLLTEKIGLDPKVLVEVLSRTCLIFLHCFLYITFYETPRDSIFFFEPDCNHLNVSVSLSFFIFFIFNFIKF